MDNYKSVIILLLLPLYSIAQIEQPATLSGKQENVLSVKNAFKFPTRCGSPQGVAQLTWTDTSRAAFIYDSCNHRLWVYDPRLNLWDTIKGGASKLQEIFDKESAVAVMNKANTISTGVFDFNISNSTFQGSPPNRSTWPSASVNKGDLTINSQNYSELGLVVKKADYGGVSNDIYNFYETGVNPPGSVAGYGAASAGWLASCLNPSSATRILMACGFKGNSPLDSAAGILYSAKGLMIASDGNAGYVDFKNSWVGSPYARFAAITNFLGLNTLTPLYRLDVNDSMRASGIMLNRRTEYSGPAIMTNEYLTIANLGTGTEGLTIFESRHANLPSWIRFQGGNGSAMSGGVGVIEGFNYDGPDRQNFYFLTSGFNAHITHKGGNLVFIPGTNYSRFRDLSQYTGDSVKIMLNTDNAYRPYLYVRGRLNLTDSAKLNDIAYYTTNLHYKYNIRTLIDKEYADSIAALISGGTSTLQQVFASQNFVAPLTHSVATDITGHNYRWVGGYTAISINDSIGHGEANIITGAIRLYANTASGFATDGIYFHNLAASGSDAALNEIVGIVAGGTFADRVGRIQIGSGLSIGSGILSATGSGGGWSLTGNSASSPGTEFLGYTSNNSLKFRTNNTQKAVLDSSGVLGIGVAQGSVYLSSYGDLKMLVDGGWGVTYAGILHSYLTNGGGNARMNMRNGSFADKIQLNTNGDNFLAGGNVGIGTTTPAVQLHVINTAEQLRLGYDATNYLPITIASNGVANLAPTGGTIQVTGNITATLGAVFNSSSGVNDFRVESDANANMLYVSAVNDRVGIGAGSPSAQLHTTGTVRFANFGAGAATFDASGNVSSASDGRLKNIIKPYSIGLCEIIQLNPIVYKWNKKSNMEMLHEYAGLDAREVYKVFGELGSGENKEGYRTIQDRALIAALINSVKELNKRVEYLEKKLNQNK